MPFNIAIDGPAGAGKTTTAKKIAQHFGFVYVDTGALYRAIAYWITTQGKNPSDSEQVLPMLESINLSVEYIDNVQHTLVNGTNTTAFLRTPEISVKASDVSAIPEVRKRILYLQRSIAATHNSVMEGRDIGTVILPNANVKFFLTADIEIRAQRRFDELNDGTKHVRYSDILNDMCKRDYNDSNRSVAPLKKADDAIEIDTSNMPHAYVVSKMIKIIKERM